MMKKVIVIDPGLTTGVVKYDRETHEFSPSQLNFDSTCEYLLGESVFHRKEVVLVAESFIITAATPRMTQAPWSLEMIGVARMCSRLYCERDLFVQAQSSAMRFSSDQRLKLMGWYRPGMGHANDAARHLLLFLVTRGWLEPELLKSIAECY